MGVEAWPEPHGTLARADLRSNVRCHGNSLSPHKWHPAWDILQLPPEDEPLCPHEVVTLTVLSPLSKGERAMGVTCSVLILQRETEALEDTRLAESHRPGRAEPGWDTGFLTPSKGPIPTPAGWAQEAEAPSMAESSQACLQQHPGCWGNCQDLKEP